MRGRRLFNIFYVFLIVLSWLFKLLPLRIRYMFYGLIFNRRSLVFSGIRYSVIRSILKRCGKNVYFSSHVVIKNLHNVSLGDNISVHEFSYIDGTGGIDIGDDVSIAHSSSLISSSHNYDKIDVPIRDQGTSSQRIIIENNVWLATGVTVLTGSVIKEGCILAAGCIYNDKVGIKNGIFAGVPAKVIKKRD